MFRTPAAALLALLAAGSALAAPSFDRRPDKVFQSKSYYQASGGASCPGASACAIYFPKIDGKDGVIIRQASCIVTHRAPIVLAYLGVADKKNDNELDPSVALQIPAAAVLNGASYSQFNQGVLIRIPSGKLPAMTALTNAPNGVDIYCTISGEPE